MPQPVLFACVSLDDVGLENPAIIRAVISVSYFVHTCCMLTADDTTNTVLKPSHEGTN